MENGLTFAELEPDSDERFVTLRRSLGVSTFGLNQIRLQPRQRGASTATPARRRSTWCSRARSP